MDGTAVATREPPKSEPPQFPPTTWRGVLPKSWRRRQKFSRQMMLGARIDSILQGRQLDPHPDRRETAIEHAKIALNALQQEEFERAWRNILVGERLVFEGHTDAQITARASALSAEAVSMLPSEDAKPILDILSRATTDKNPPSGWREMVIEAQFLFERRLIFLNDTKERTAFRISLLIACMSAFIAAFVALLWASDGLLNKLYNPAQPGTTEAAAPEATAMTMPMVLGTFILGGLGACLSALLSFTSLGRVPGTFESPWVTFARPMVGAASGLIAVMLVRASLIDFKNAAAIGLVAFLFGFSERLVIGAVQRLEPAQKG